MELSSTQTSLSQQLQEQIERNELLVEENKKLHQKIEYLIEQLAAMQRLVYGRKSEKVNEAQLQMFVDGVREEETPAATDPDDETPDFEELPDSVKKKKRGRHPGRASLPGHLERKVTHLHPDDLDCPCCGSEMSEAGEEASEELGIVPARFFVRRTVRHKYACRVCEDAVVRPELPAVAIEKSMAGSDVLSAIVVSKYADHLPLYRQQQIYRREGVELQRATMCNWVGQCSFLLEPIVAQMKVELLASSVVQSDDTTVKYLERPGPAKKGYLWAYVSLEGDVIYDFTRGRSRDGPTCFLAGFKGTLQVDGYAGYNEVFATKGIKHAACWAHVRRKFENALASAPAEAAVVMQAIQTLYGVEKELRQEPRPAHDEIRKVRQEKSKPVVEKLKEILVAYREQALPKSALGRAIEYAFGQWDWLETYLANGRVDIDNNSCERAMRRVAVGRKNWLFTGSSQGGTNAAVLYTIIETCVRNGINPHEYLTDVLVRVGTHPQSKVAELAPRGWAKRKLEAGV